MCEDKKDELKIELGWCTKLDYGEQQCRKKKIHMWGEKQKEQNEKNILVRELRR